MMFGLIILAIVVYYIYSSNSKGTFYGSHPMNSNNPLDILSERYARGEINREEYLERKEGLTGKRKPVSLAKD